jgi:hypothetical protein
MTSEIKVDNIKDIASTNIVNKCGTTINIGAPGDTTKLAANTIRSNALQNACGGNTISKCATTVTIGQSGDTVNLASGASQTGFGRTGTVDWDTSIKTTGFTAVSGSGYFCNTTSGTFTLTLPTSPSAGDIVALKDYANTFDNNKLTIGRGGSNIEGVASDVSVTVEGQAITMVFIDGTQGWKIIDQGKKADVGFPEYVTATGGCCVVTCGDYKVHVFKAPGTFCVSSVGNACGSTTVCAVVVAGGGGGGSFYGGAGGAGGLVLDNDGFAVSASPGSYAIAIGGGGSGPPGNPTNGTPGANSTGLGYTANGGGHGAGGGGPADCGGSGGGQGGGNPGGGSANQPGVSNPGATNYGNPGGPYFATGGSGGGGAGGAGAIGPAGLGGVGLDVGPTFGTYTDIGIGDARPGYASNMYLAGGGGGQGNYGGAGGGALALGPACVGSRPDAHNGQVNTGGGGRGDGNYTGGSGVVLIKYKFQN